MRVYHITEDQLQLIRDTTEAIFSVLHDLPSLARTQKESIFTYAERLDMLHLRITEDNTIEED